MPASLASAPAPGAIAPSRRDRHIALSHRLLYERCRYQAGQILYEPVFGAALIGLTVSSLDETVPGLTLYAWASIFGLALMVRLWAAARLLRERHCRDASGYAALFRLSAGLTGLLLGAAASLFFPHLEHAGRLMLTLALSTWLAASLPLHAAFPRHGRLHIGLILSQLALAWWLAEPHSGGGWAATLMVCAIMLDRLSAALGRTLARAQAGRHHRRDLLRRLALESGQARRASATAARFLAAASHDLRQPATALSLMSNLLEQRCDDRALQPLVQAIARSSTALNDLLGNLLDLSRLDAGVVQADPAWIEIDSILADLRAEFDWRMRDKGLELEVEGCAGQLLSDRVLLMRMLRNLLENALRYTPSGRVSIRASCRRDLCFEVTDTGIGISLAQRAHLFSGAPTHPGENTRRRSTGLGIGLSMVGRIAALLDARLDVDSDGATWSRFSVTLPARLYRDNGKATTVTQRDGDGSAATGHRSPSLAATPNRLALVVEDAMDVASAVQELLESRGYRVECRTEAKGALALLQGPDQFDLILSDYHLGGVIDGIDLLIEARRLQPQARCLLTTADTAADARLRAETVGLELLKKPLQADLLG